jgi:hypothetical protein
LAAAQGNTIRSPAPTGVAPIHVAAVAIRPMVTGA